jgi:hypothetical protein
VGVRNAVGVEVGLVDTSRVSEAPPDADWAGAVIAVVTTGAQADRSIAMTASRLKNFTGIFNFQTFNCVSIA